MFKKLSFVLLAILFSWGIAFAETAGTRLSPGKGEIVTMPYQSDPPKKFRVVRYIGGAGAATLAAESIVIWDLTVDDGVTVATTTTSSDSAVAGIIVQDALTQDTADNTAVQDIAKDNWTWLQTYGTCQVFVDSVVNVAGAAMGTSSTAGEASMYVPSTTVGLNQPRRQGYAGFFFDTATAGDNDVECFIKAE